MKDLTTGNEGRRVISFTIPMIVGNILQQSYQVVNSIIVGQYLGKEAIGAIGASFPIIFLLISLVVGISNGSTIIIAQYYGARDYEKIKKAVDTMNIFMFGSSIIISVMGIYFASDIFSLVQLPENVSVQATAYLQIYLAGLVGLFGFHASSAVLRGLGDSKTPLYFQAGSIIANALLDVLFIGVWGWGIESVAVATIISQAGTFAATTLYLNKTHELIKLKVRSIQWDGEVFVQSIRIGLPSGLQQSIVAMGMMAVLWMVNDFGTDVLAAYSIAGRIDMFATIPAMTFSYGLSTFVGQNIGAGRWDRASRGFRATLIVSIIMSVLLSAIIIIFSHEIMSAFTLDQDVIRMGQDYLMIVSAFYPVFAAFFITNGILRGAGDTIVPMFVTLFILWGIRIPASYIMSLHWGERGIWLGIPASWTAGMVITFLWYKTGRWKRKTIVKDSIDSLAEVVE